jgi:hypothetical protein
VSVIEILPILAPTLPIFPAPPLPPTAPAPPVADPRGFARALAKRLRDNKHDEVVSAIENLAAPDRDKVEAALIPTLTRDKLKREGLELRRIIRFVRNRPGPLRPGDPFTASGGREVALKDNKLPRGGIVSAKTGISAVLSGKESNEAYSITYDGPNAAEMRWLQMIWREVVQEFPAKGKVKARSVPIKRRLDNPNSVSLGWYLSTHPDRTKESSKRRWNTDSLSVNSPFYTQLKLDGSKLIMLDFPSAMPIPGLAAQLFAAVDPPNTVVTGFHAETYLVHDMEVLYRVNIDITWEIDRNGKVAPGKISASGARTDGLDGAQRACLAIQHPEAGYLPGAAIPAPLPDDEFDPVQDLAEADWSKHTNDFERYEDVADVARAELIRDVTGKGASTINRSAPVVVGLNYLANFSYEGETGFVDSNKTYQKSHLPADHDASPPKVAIILGGKAFGLGNTVFGKDSPVATMRHEMLHAAHATLAIGWFVKFRDDFTDLGFKEWLSTQKMSDLDLKIVSSFIDLDLSTTELLSWTEGFVTTLPFLPTVADIKLLKVKEKWPAAVRELRGAGDQYARAVDVARNAALARIRKVICSSVTSAQREVLIKWINAVLDPSKIDPPPEKSTVVLINSFFRTQTSWLKKVLDQATKPCPK